MQCSVRTESDHNCGNNTMKTINSYKNHYKKEANVDSIVEQVASRLRSIENREGPPPGMPIEHAEAVRRYYAAFPALKKGEESPQQYYLPPPAWCRTAPRAPRMQSDVAKDWSKGKRFPGKERRNSGHGPKKNNRRRCNLGRALDGAAPPEWLSGDGSWDMDGPDPVRDFIRALALDEGYGTCENSRPELAAPAVPAVRASPPEPDLDLYAAFEAKFDRSLEALWARDPTPDDYRELPVDFAELLASPSDRLWEPPPLADAVWAPASPPLHVRLRPLHLASPPPPPELRAFALLDGDELSSALARVADTLRSLAAINHSRDASGFAEVPPRRADAAPPPRRAPAPAPSPPPEREDLLTAARTHFRPIRREGDAEGARYADGDTFDVRAEPEPAPFRRSDSGGAYLGAERYLEYGAGAALPLRFPLRQRDAAAQTDAWPPCDGCGGAAKKMRAGGSRGAACGGECGGARAGPAPAPDELSRDWEELLADISAAHAAAADDAAPAPADRKRRHSAALRCARQCAHPHARFLPCCALDRPLTR